MCSSLFLFIFTCLICSVACKTSQSYVGEYFPAKYLVPDDVESTVDDINLYVSSLERLVGYCSHKPNSTSGSQGLSMYLTKAILKRSLQDYSQKIGPVLRPKLKALIAALENLNTHYVYENLQVGVDDAEFRISRLYVEDEAQIYSIEPFNRHRLIKWILSKSDMNKFSKDMDTLVFPKERYVYLVTIRKGYHIKISVSDYCLGKIVHNPLPIDLKQMPPCKLNSLCDEAIHSTPSVAYGLSHRLLNMLLMRHTRRCYLRSPEGDRQLMDNLCAQMYREAVYLARRGFFARDLFLEHVALCSILGYEEFHRRHWLHKAASWVDSEGCVAETRNFLLNQTAISTNRLKERKADGNRVRRERKHHLQYLLEDCQTHEMAMAKMVMANGIRYALHNLTGNTE